MIVLNSSEVWSRWAVRSAVLGSWLGGGSSGVVELVEGVSGVDRASDG